MAYDFDGTNRIDFEEFYSIIKKFDPRIQPAGVRKTFEQVPLPSMSVCFAAFAPAVLLHSIFESPPKETRVCSFGTDSGVQVGADDLEFAPTHFCKWLALIFGKAEDADFNSGCKMLLDECSPEAVMGYAESMRHTLRQMWQWRVADVLQRKWMPELTFEEVRHETAPATTASALHTLFPVDRIDHFGSLGHTRGDRSGEEVALHPQACVGWWCC